MNTYEVVLCVLSSAILALWVAGFMVGFYREYQKHYRKFLDEEQEL